MNIKEAEKFLNKWFNEKGYVAIDEADDIEEALIGFARQQVIKYLKKHIECPTKPGYKRHDILDEIKNLENG